MTRLDDFGWPEIIYASAPDRPIPRDVMASILWLGKFTAYLTRGSMVLLFALSVSACGTKQTLDQAIHCDEFHRLPDGSWSTTKDVSLDYLLNGIQYQLNYSKDVHIKQIAQGDGSQLTAALDKKCVSNP